MLVLGAVAAGVCIGVALGRPQAHHDGRQSVLDDLADLFEDDPDEAWET
jgi:hypothetical protein